MRTGFLVALMAVALVVPAAHAGITGATFQVDGDGALGDDMVAFAEWAMGEPGINFLANGTQFWGPGHLGGEISADEDPAATSNNTILNDTGFRWSGYTVNVYLNKPFTITGATGPAGWNLPAIVDATFGSYTDGDGRDWDYMGTVNYTSPAPAHDILVGSSGTFGVSFNWIGTSLYQLELVPVPEPMSLALLALGGLFLRRRTR